MVNIVTINFIILIRKLMMKTKTNNVVQLNLSPLGLNLNAKQEENVRELIFNINCMTNKPIKDFVIDVFTDPKIINKFVSIPASSRHHHCEKGGLIEHSNECATQVISQKNIINDDLELDLGIAAALLHDIGKLKTLSINGLTSSGNYMGHEDYTLVILEPFLVKLGETYKQAELSLRHILVYKYEQHRYPRFPIINIVKMADRYSAAKDMQRKSFASKPEYHHYSKIVSGRGYQVFNRLVS
jgi:23S rRNA maturation-related 3'-5' exoribonuclease YhaM